MRTCLFVCVHITVMLSLCLNFITDHKKAVTSCESELVDESEGE